MTEDAPRTVTFRLPASLLAKLDNYVLRVRRKSPAMAISRESVLRTIILRATRTKAEVSHEG